MLRIIAAALIVIAIPLAAFAEDKPLAGLLDSLGNRQELVPLKTVVIARNGEIVAEQGYRGHTTSESANIKSASKSIISALVGIAISKGLLEGPDQKIAPILKGDLPDNPDPRLKGAHPELRSKVIVPDVLIQPHSASLGITFYTGTQFPAEYRGDLFAAEHGSWNRANSSE